MDLTVIINFFNMQREAKRTLATLSARYQRGCDDINYEVIAIDHGSSEPLDPNLVASAGGNFRYRYLETDSASPCRALNAAVDDAASEFVLVSIDGARMFSPGVIAQCFAAADRFDHPFVFGLNAHIGSKKQFQLLDEGYTQADEDALLEAVDWREDGYRLFDISCLGNPAANDSGPNESNVVFLRKADFKAVGGYNPAFESPGGGFASIDLFKRLIESPGIDPILIVGEATFHQMHGGAVTGAQGAARKERMAAMRREYAEITGSAPKRQSYAFERMGEPHDRWRGLIEREER
jgi:glycosyl transferase family 2